jgi:hypothetical protein
MNDRKIMAVMYFSWGSRAKQQETLVRTSGCHVEYRYKDEKW